MSSTATAFYECENAVGHATAHLDREEQIEVYECLIASWQETIRELREETSLS